MCCKKFASIAAFVIAFTFSVFITPQPQPTQQNFLIGSKRNVTPDGEAMTSLLRKDIGNGFERLDLADEEMYPQRVREYIEASSMLNDSSTPPEFQKAWHAHLNAWRNYSKYLNSLSADELKNYRSEQRHQKLNREISRTWYKVLEIAESYNAEVPANAY